MRLVLVIGYPASGKTTVAKSLKDFERLNRDEAGGKTTSLLPKLEALLKDGKDVVIDGTFATAEKRFPFIELGIRYDATVECQWLNTGIEDAQYNACQRMVRKYGHLLMPDEVRQAAKKSPNIFPPGVLFSYRKNFEDPSMDEGFDRMTEVPFVRTLDQQYNGKALILDYDGTLRSVSGGDRPYPLSRSQIQIPRRRREVLKDYIDKGYKLLGVSNQSGVGEHVFSSLTAKVLFDATNEKLGHNIDYRFCHHKAGPINCWCRKPMCGWGVEFIEKYKLDPAQCIMVGDLKTDETFAKRCGFEFAYADRFFE